MKILLQIVVLLCSVGALTCCGPDGVRINVTVNGLDENVVALELTAYVDGIKSSGASGRIQDPLNRFVVRLPGDLGRERKFELEVGGIDKEGCQIAGIAGHNPASQRSDPLTISASADGNYSLSVELEQSARYRGCMIVVERIGNQGGTVKVIQTMEPAGQAKPPMSPKICTFVANGEGIPCELGPFPPPIDRVTLSVTTDAGTYPGGTFGGWFGACSGQDDCQVSMGSGRAHVRAVLAPKRVCGTDGFCWEAPLPVDTNLFGLWGSGPDDVWAFGEADGVLHWDGASWLPYRSDALRDVRALWGSAANDVWALANFGDVMRWDGVAWTKVGSGLHGQALWGSGPNDVWVVGFSGIWHWDGATWDHSEPGRVNEFRGVWGSGPNDVWVVGRDGILHWNGATWSRSLERPPSEPSSVWGSGPNDVWVLASNQILHWNGATWSPSLREGSSRLSSMWGSGPNDVWAVGHDVWHWDGRTWSLSLMDPVPGLGLNAVWGSGPRNAWAVGYTGTILFWNGARWTSRSTFSGWNQLSAIWGSSATDLWAVSEEGTIVHWDGAQLSSSLNGIAVKFYDVWGSGPKDVWAVGAEGAIWHWDGSFWRPSESKTTELLSGVWGSGKDDVWGVGSKGTLLHFTGSSWSPVSTGTRARLSSIWGSRYNDFWIVGSEGTVLHQTEFGLDSVNDVHPNQSNFQFQRVWGSGPNDIWIVESGGSSGFIFHRKGTTWSQPFFSKRGLVGISGSGPDDVWFSGYWGMILRWDGRDFREMNSGTSSLLSGIWVTTPPTDPKEVWVVGGRNVLRRRRQ